MPLGALNPFPFRLGGDLTAEQHSRVVSDVVSQMRTAPLCVMVVEAGVPLVCFGRNGIGVTTPDGSTYLLGGNLTYSASTTSGLAVSLGTSWVDEIGAAWPVNITAVDAIPIGTSAAVTATTVSLNTFSLTGPGASDSYVIVVYTDDVSRTIDDYGGSLDKRNCTTEADSPYAWGWLLEMRQARGSAYATGPGVLVDVENIAWARMYGFLQRVGEQESAASDPANTSGGRLARWAKWLGLVINDGESEAVTRARCAAFKRIRAGAADWNLIPIIRGVLGSQYVGIYRDKGTFTSPPPNTYWSEVTIPAAFNTAFNLGTGGGTVANDELVWSSERFNLRVIVQVPQNQTEQDVTNNCLRNLMPLLDRLEPSVADFSWGRLDTSGGASGFILDQSKLDFDLL